MEMDSLQISSASDAILFQHWHVLSMNSHNNLEC
jgi:hypothetical protein